MNEKEKSKNEKIEKENVNVKSTGVEVLYGKRPIVNPTY